MHVRQQEAARLEHRQELRLAGLCERGEEGVAALGHAQLQHGFVVRDRIHVLHTRRAQSRTQPPPRCARARVHPGITTEAAA